MIYIDARRRRAGKQSFWPGRVIVNGREMREVEALGALWNGGPGFVRFLRRGADRKYVVERGAILTRVRFAYSVKYTEEARKP